jgi:hypothetical protein
MKIISFRYQNVERISDTKYTKWRSTEVDIMQWTYIGI